MKQVDYEIKTFTARKHQTPEYSKQLQQYLELSAPSAPPLNACTVL